MTTTFARCWSVARTDGLILGFTDHDRIIEFGGIAFRPENGLTSRAIVQGAGLSVDNTEAHGILSDAAITEVDLLAGRWDRAEVTLWQVDWTDVASRRIVFRGLLGEISRANGAFTAALEGLGAPLNQQQGRVFHPRCSAALGDAACGVDLHRDGLWAEWTIETVEDGTRLRFAGTAAFADRWFEGGRIEVLTGAAQGLSGKVKNDRAQADGDREVHLWTAPGIWPVAGDRVRLTAGCDKAHGTCRMKFGNLNNFRGFPHIPTEDWLLAPHAAAAGRGG